MTPDIILALVMAALAGFGVGMGIGLMRRAGGRVPKRSRVRCCDCRYKGVWHSDRRWARLGWLDALGYECRVEGSNGCITLRDPVRGWRLTPCEVRNKNGRCPYYEPKESVHE